MSPGRLASAEGSGATGVLAETPRGAAVPAVT